MEERLTWREKRVEMRARVDPRLGLLPKKLQALVRSSRYYRSPSNLGQPRVYVSELITSDCDILSQAGVASSAGILDALGHPRPEVREAARGLVGWLGWRRAARTLLRQFKEQSEERQSLGETLAKLDSRRARKQLIKWMTSDPDPEFRWQAARSLFDDGDVSLATSFLAVVNNEDATDKLRRLAIEGVAVCLGEQDRRSRLWRDSTQALMPYLDHPDWRFRWEAAFALGQAGASKALPRLHEMAENDTEIRQNNDLWPLTEIISWLE